MAEKSDGNRKELEKQTGVSGSKGAVAIAMGQALLTKGCTKDLLERLKVVYELAGFPGKAPGLDHGRGRQLLKKQDGGTSTEHKSASCSIPRGPEAGWGFPASHGNVWVCTGLLHRSQGMAGSRLCSRHLKGMGYFGHRPALLARCCFSSVTLCSCSLGLLLSGL